MLIRGGASTSERPAARHATALGRNARMAMTRRALPSIHRGHLLTGCGIVAMGGAAAGVEPSSNTGAQESKSAAVAPSICVFDVNETLLDIEFIAPLFHRLFGDAKVLREWFGQLVLYSNVITLSGSYTPFFALG